MRKFLIFVVLFLSICATTNAEVNVKLLNNLQGTWYDKATSPIYKIKGDTINNYKIIDTSNLVGSYWSGSSIFKIIKNGQYENLYVSWTYAGSGKKTMNIEGLGLHRETDKNIYYESIGGVYLGMPEADLLRVYGTPQKIFKEKEDGVNAWLYFPEGMMVSFTNDCISTILIMNEGNRKFDRTGLDCTNSFDDFAKKYNFKNLQQNEANSIAQDEWIVFGKTIYPKQGWGPQFEYIVLTTSII